MKIMRKLILTLIFILIFIGIIKYHKRNVHRYKQKFRTEQTIFKLNDKLNITTANKINRSTSSKHQNSRRFEVDYNRNLFLLNGKEFVVFSGSIHYFRIPKYYWKDRLLKMKAAGLNTIELYIPWNFHQPKANTYYFTEEGDIESFISFANDLRLNAIVRIGPYICAEWENGGLPGWLYSIDKHMKLRSSDLSFMEQTIIWFNVLLPKLKPLLYSNDGNIIMIQIENEYGSFDCDRKYITELVNTVVDILGEDVVYFTTDNANFPCSLPFNKQLLMTTDFGSKENIDEPIKNLQSFQRKGPLMNSEFYTGWVNYWGYTFQRVSSNDLIIQMMQMINRKIHINFYMFTGGTNFGFWNGAYIAEFADVKSSITSYDYDAPISEAGDLTWKYQEIRRIANMVFGKPKDWNAIKVENTTKVKYDNVVMQESVNFIDKLFLNLPEPDIMPLSMEDLDHFKGYMYYIANTENYKNLNMTLFVPIFQDYAYIYVADKSLKNFTYLGTMETEMGQSIPKRITVDDNLIILIENAGHSNYGKVFRNNLKGILTEVLLNKHVIEHWRHVPLDDDIIKNLSSITYRNSSMKSKSSYLYKGYLQIKDLTYDTFLVPKNFNKGFVMVNNINIGRFWNSRGPTETLFLPKSFLKVGVNSIVIFELMEAPCLSTCQITFHTDHIIKY